MSLRLYPLFAVGMVEVPVDPHSLFWRLREEVDPLGDPLSLMLQAEAGEEVACAIMSGAA